jgi:hypothetical protein
MTKTKQKQPAELFAPLDDRGSTNRFLDFVGQNPEAKRAKEFLDRAATEENPANREALKFFASAPDYFPCQENLAGIHQFLRRSKLQFNSENLLRAWANMKHRGTAKLDGTEDGGGATQQVTAELLENSTDTEIARSMEAMRTARIKRNIDLGSAGPGFRRN